MEFKKLQIARKPIQKTEVNITEFWKNFKSPTVLKETGQISNLHFSPSNNGQLAVTAGCKVSIYNTSTNSLVKSISRFQDLAYSGTIRDDGKLMVAGDASGVVQIFDLSSRSILRTFKGHNGSVPCTKFMPNVQQILTASYDKTVKIWDVPSQSPIISFEGHEDYIKTAVVNPSNHSQIISGSYDHCVKLWDVRSGQCTSTINHQAPIESIEVFGNGGMIAVGGGPSIQVYDLISGKSLITLDNFQKTVTSVKLTKDGGFLMGGSLDRYVKCYDTSDWSLCNSVKFPGMVSAIDISNDNTHMVVGMTTGIFSIQTNKVQKSQNAPLLPKSEREFGNERLKRKYEDIPSTENVVVVEKEARASKYYQFDHLLRKFKYKEALDAALRTHDPALGFGLISELIRRGGLISALSGRDDVSLQPIIAYLARNLRNHTDKSLIIDVTQLVMELYGDVVWKSKHLDAQLRRLMTSIYNEKKLVQNLIQFQGRLGMVLSKVNGNGSN